MIRSFFERLIEWDWPKAPRRKPTFHGDIPPRTDPLPKFLDDHSVAKLISTAELSAPFDRNTIGAERYSVRPDPQACGMRWIRQNGCAREGRRRCAPSTRLCTHEI